MIPGSERSSGEGNGNSLQYSCLENSMDRGARWVTVNGAAKRDVTKKLTHTMGLQLCGLKDTQHILIRSPILAVGLLCARYSMGYQGHMKNVQSQPSRSILCGEENGVPHPLEKAMTMLPPLANPVLGSLGSLTWVEFLLLGSAQSMVPSEYG